jgi:riboflavin kinase/FMN adenylyltransferase
MINGQYTIGMCNLGTRPTFNEVEFVIEVHFFNNNIESLYGNFLKVEFLKWIREEKKFSSPSELVVQLNIDKQLCLDFQGKYE